MYKSAKAIQVKFGQAKYVYKQILKFKNRIFVNNGIDEETGVNPFIIHLSTFLTNTRSILQYANKEAKDSGNLSQYEARVAERPIFNFFKQLRDTDIHQYTIGSHIHINTAVNMMSSDSGEDTFTSGEIRFLVEDFSDLDSPKGSNDDLDITTTLSKHIDVNDELISRLKLEGREDLIKTLKTGEELYETQEFDGERDLFKLCEKYLVELEEFVNISIADGLIS